MPSFEHVVKNNNIEDRSTQHSSSLYSPSTCPVTRPPTTTTVVPNFCTNHGGLESRLPIGGTSSTKLGHPTVGIPSYPDEHRRLRERWIEFVTGVTLVDFSIQRTAEPLINRHGKSVSHSKSSLNDSYESVDEKRTTRGLGGNERHDSFSSVISSVSTCTSDGNSNHSFLDSSFSSPSESESFLSDMCDSSKIVGSQRSSHIICSSLAYSSSKPTFISSMHSSTSNNAKTWCDESSHLDSKISDCDAETHFFLPSDLLIDDNDIDVQNKNLRNREESESDFSKITSPNVIGYEGELSNLNRLKISEADVFDLNEDWKCSPQSSAQQSSRLRNSWLTTLSRKSSLTDEAFSSSSSFNSSDDDESSVCDVTKSPSLCPDKFMDILSSLNHSVSATTTGQNC